MSGGTPCYKCLRCETPVSFARVERMSRIGRESFMVWHTCICTPGHVFERHLSSNHMAIMRLLGGLKPVLPYVAAPAPAHTLMPEQERQCRVFQWECEQLDSVHEFLLLASRPALR